MKKLFLALLAGSMIFAFCACGNTSAEAEEETDTEVVASDSDAEEVVVEEYTSDGELIVDSSELPATDSDLEEEE